MSSKPLHAKTPMLKQYLSIKEQNPGVLLLFRLGDFYELFFDDAVTVAQCLNIVLTKRAQKDEDVPMCGIPFHAADNYISRLLKEGFKVAICEQLETPEEAKKRGYKEIVRRDVVRILTPGTLVEDTFLDGHQNNFLTALSYYKEMCGLATIDLSTGEFFTESVPPIQLDSALERLKPKEILMSDRFIKLPTLYDLFKHYKKVITLQPDSRFNFESNLAKLQKAFQVHVLDAFGQFTREEIQSAGAIIDYIQLTQKATALHIHPPHKLLESSFMHMDAATQKSLEILETQKGEKVGSLFHAINRTLTAGGHRLLYRNLAFPLVDLQKIEKRLKQVSFFLNQTDLLASLREILAQIPDGERLFSRIKLNKAGPRDLGGLRHLLKEITALSQRLAPFSESIPFSTPDFREVSQTLSAALKDELPTQLKEGNFIRKSYHQELDRLKNMREEATKTIAALQARYSQETGISSLKIKYNNILGYYIEVTSAHKNRVPETFSHRQTLVNGARFTTDELLDLQEKVLSSSQKALDLEISLFSEIVKNLSEQADDFLKVFKQIAYLDLVTSFATLAQQQNYTQPRLCQTNTLLIQNGRHPVVEQMLSKSDTAFVANTCHLDTKQQVILLTGPNMAGKSTFLRQNALIILLAQIGCYVPADHAEIGIVDRLFSRVGASDDLARGHSTFMIEMLETASILNQATSRSFVILDEIGRGTSTQDGLALATATLEFLHDSLRCRALFATHYHELVQLAQPLAHVTYQTFKIKEWEEQIIFMHTVIEGAASQSYGIHVAALAGMPADVIKRAKDLLVSFEKSQPSSQTQSIIPQPSTLEKNLRAVQLDHLTPKQALDLIYQWRKDL